MFKLEHDTFGMKTSLFWIIKNLIHRQLLNETSLQTHRDFKQKWVKMDSIISSLFIFSKGMYNCVESYNSYERVVNKL